jgi:Ca2+-binding RTX toxin-like protein
MNGARWLTALTAAAVAATCAVPAQASFVEFTQGRALYWAAPGEVNDLYVGGGRSIFRFRDHGAAIRVGHGCAEEADGWVRCGNLNDARVAPLLVYVRDGDDRVIADSGIALDLRAYGGGGSDALHAGTSGEETVTAALFGGPGEDRLTTAIDAVEGFQTLDGGPDDDSLIIHRAGGATELIGGRGDDVLEPNFMERVADGALAGGLGDDTYVMTLAGPSASSLTDIAPGPGTDTLELRWGHADLATCQRCVERVVGSYDANIIIGDDWPNILLGGGGDDVIDGRGGRDTLGGDSGEDMILARDQDLDAVACGDGVDRVGADSDDVVDADCEIVFAELLAGELAPLRFR